jgi:hypothetical protein
MIFLPSVSLSLRSKRSASCLLLGLSFLPITALGIVDVHDEYYAAPEAATLSVVSVDFSGASGNDSRQSFSLEGHQLWRREDQTILLIGSYAKADSGGADTADNRFLHARYVRALTGRSGVEGFLQTQQDRFQKLDARHLLGVGYRFETLSPDRRRVLLGLGGFAERERFVDLATTETNYRANVYLTAEIPLSLANASTLSLSAYVQPKFSDPSDLRSIAMIKFETQLTQAFSMDLTVAFDNDSNPLSGVDAQNLRYSSGITYKFKK